MSPFSLRKLGVGILDEGLDLSDRFKEPLLVAAGAVVARELEHVHRVGSRLLLGGFVEAIIELTMTKHFFLGIAR